MVTPSPFTPHKGAFKRAFTLLEMVVTIAIMGLILGFTIPQIRSASTLSQEQTAKATINGILDTVMGTYGRVGSQGAWNTNFDPIRPPAPDVSSTTLQSGNPDVLVTPGGDQVSIDNHHASVATIYTGSNWRVGVAVLSKNSADKSNDTFSCWYAWRDVDGYNSSGTEAYFAYDPATVSDQADCTGQIAARLVVPTTSSAGEGRSWAHPVTLSQAEVVQARTS
jgi:prepilin-type N-terminal cleavage/methylation domain-containing protein